MSTALTATAENSQLAPLAKKINDATNSAEASVRTSMDRALEAGALLTEAKKLVQHGEWENWLTANCDVAPRTAQAYMRLAKSIPLLDEAKAQRVADLPVREAVRAISTNPTQPVQTRHQNIFIAKKDDADRAATALKKSANALRAAAKNIDYLRTMKGAQIASLRKKLTDAIDAIDKMEADVNHE